MKVTLKIGVLASGRGSNFQAIIDSIESGRIQARIELLVTDNPEAFSLERAEKHGIESLVLRPKDYGSREAYFTAVAAELKKQRGRAGRTGRFYEDSREAAAGCLP